MSQPTQRKRKYKIVFCKGNTLTKVALLGVIVLSIVALIAIHGAIKQAKAKADALQQAALTEALEREELEKDIAELGSADSVEKIAGEELGLVDPDSVVFVEDGE